ncbi:MAG TPA: hypothetical protein VFX98_19295, partial [Longimicrobiaceae bacterium]|nr:hypothetical protein [Longimicrobiaceae bacterium]
MSIDWSTILWVAGTLIVVILGRFSSRFWDGDEEKRRRSDNSKYLQAERRIVYSRFLRVADQLAAFRVSAEGPPIELRVEWLGLLADIELLASADTQEHASAWGEAVSEHVFNSGKGHLPSDVWETR